VTAPLWGEPDGAVLDATQRYRYRLWRTLPAFAGSAAGRVLFVMLNPSTADAHRDDHTLARCRYFAARHTFARLDVVNLYAYRATKPHDLALADDPIGPRNDDHIAEAAREADLVIVATGELLPPRPRPPRLAGCSTIAMAARHGQNLRSAATPSSVTCKACLRNVAWDPDEQQRRAAAQRAGWAAATRQTAIRAAARNRAASAVLRRHRRAFLAAYEAEAALLTLAGERPTVHGIDWPES
jgi:hypothetical protein